MAALL
jgi:hypothetical protein